MIWYVNCYHKSILILSFRTHVFFLNTIFVSIHMYPENPERTQVIVGSMNMVYISDTARNRTHNLFRPKWEPIPLGHSDGMLLSSRIRFDLKTVDTCGVSNTCTLLHFYCYVAITPEIKEWMLACRNVVVAGVICTGRGRRLRESVWKMTLFVCLIDYLLTPPSFDD